MNFFHGQETLTAMEWILRAIIAYFFLIVIAKIMGQRAISQLRLLDFVMALVIGNIIAHPLSDEELGLKGSMITTLVLTTLYLVSIFSILKWPGLRKWINHAPIILIQNGEILSKGLNKARISIDVLLEELRKEKVEDVKNVALAMWEADGKMSVFLDPQYEPVTPAALKIKTEPFDMPKTIIKEGKLIRQELNQMNKDEDWLISSLKNNYQAEIQNVLLATLDKKGSLKVFLYNPGP